MPEIVVHHLERSRSHRVLWLLEELGVPYAMRVWKRERSGRAPKELRAVHPLGRAPIVVVDGVALAESGAILEELVERVGDGRFRPTDDEGMRRARFWLHYAEGSLMPPLLVALIFGRVRKAPWPVRPIARAIAAQVDRSYTRPEIDNHLSFIESELTRSPWFAGDAPSIADVQMSFPLHAAVSRAAPDAWPSIRAWLARVHARPAWQRAVDKGGPVDVGE